MYIVSSLLFACSVNIDAFFVGMSYGIRKIRILFIHNLIISLISFAGTFLSLFLGRQLLSLLPAFLAEYLGSGILLALGLFYLTKSLFRLDNSLHTEDLKFTLPLKEVFLVGAALSLNNIGIGIGIGISGILLLPTAVITCLTSALFLLVGNLLGSAPVLHISDRYADLLSGILLLLLGILR